jgi:hypothetical protein
VRQIALLLGAVIFGSSATAAESGVFTASGLLSFCTTNDDVTHAACRFFIFGAALGLHLGDSVEGLQWVPRAPKTFCIPDTMGQDEMVSIVVNDLRRLARTHPDDLKSPAISMSGRPLQYRFRANKLSALAELV